MKCAATRSVLTAALVASSLYLTGCGPVDTGSVSGAGTASGTSLLGVDATSGSQPMGAAVRASLPGAGGAVDPARALADWRGTLAAVRTREAGDIAGKLDTLIRGLASSQVLWRNVPLGSQPGGPGYTGHPFDLDGARTGQQSLEEGRGGSCGTYGRVLAEALVGAGTSPDDVWLVDTVGETERAASSAAARTSGTAGASGHQFLLVRDRSRGWLLVDTTARQLDAVPFQSPDALRMRLASAEYASDPVRVRPAESKPEGGPTFPNLTQRTETGPDGTPIQVGPPAAIFSNLVVFRVVRSTEYPNHRIGDRVQEVARVVPAVERA